MAEEDLDASVNLRAREEEFGALSKQNFNLKLRVYFLEERLRAASRGAAGGEDSASVTHALQEECIEARVLAEERAKELGEKNALLARARSAIQQLKSELDSARSEATGSTTSRDDLVRRTRALEAELARERTGASGLRADVARAAASISEWEAAVQDALAALRSRAPADDRRVLAALDALDAALREPLAAQGAGQVVAGRDGDAGRSRLATSGAGPLATSDLNGELDDESESARLAARLARLRDVWTGLWEVNRTLLSRVAVDALDATTSTADAVAQLRATRAALAEAQRGAGSALEWRARADQLESALAAEKTVNRRLLEDLERATLAARSARTAPASAASAASGGPSAAPFGSTRLGLATSLTPPPMSSSLVFGTLGDSATARSDGLVAHLQDQLRETEASRGSYAAELTRLRTQLRDAETAWSEASKQRGDAEAETLLLQSQLRQLLAERDEARSVLLRETRDAAERGALEVGRLRERLRRFRHHVRSRLDRIRAAVRGDQSSRPADWNPADGDASPPRRSTTATRLGAEWDDPPRSAARAGGVRSGSLASSAGSRGRADDGSDESRAAEDDGSLFAALDTISSLVQWFEEEGGRFSSEATGLAEELARRIEVLEGRLAQAEGAIGPALGAVRSLQSQLASRTGEAAALRERGDSLASHVEALEAALRDTERRRADGEQELGELRETNRLLTLELHEKIAALQAAAKVHRALESASDALRDHTGLGASSGFAGARSESSGVARATAIARSRASVAPPDPQDTWLQSVLDMAGDRIGLLARETAVLLRESERVSRTVPGMRGDPALASRIERLLANNVALTERLHELTNDVLRLFEEQQRGRSGTSASASSAASSVAGAKGLRTGVPPPSSFEARLRDAAGDGGRSTDRPSSSSSFSLFPSERLRRA